MSFHAYDNALLLVRCLAPVVEQLRSRSRDLADQLERAATSVVLNLAEGARRRGKDQVRFYAMAAGSASEIRAALDVAQAWGWSIACEPARELLDRPRAMLWRLTHPR